MDKENEMNSMFNQANKSVKKPKKKSAKQVQPKHRKSTKDKKITKKSSRVDKRKAYQKKEQAQYRNIRTNNYTVDALQGFQVVLGAHNRSDVLAEMIKCCKPIFLNTQDKKDKYRKMIKAIRLERSLKK